MKAFAIVAAVAVALVQQQRLWPPGSSVEETAGLLWRDGEKHLPRVGPPAGITVVPMAGKTMGADVYGFDPVYALESDDVQAWITLALQRFLVLRFHNVSHSLSPEAHVELTRIIGPVDPILSSAPSYLARGQFNSPDAVRRAAAQGISAEQLGDSMRKAASRGGAKLPPQITRVVREPGDLVAFGEGWHSDLTYRTGPPMAAVLVARELPPRGGNTWFSDMRAAWERLPPRLKDRLADRSANHTDGHDLWSIHPARRTDNRWGHDSLFMNKAFTRALVPVPGSDDQEDAELLEEVFAFIDRIPADNDDMFLNLTWHPGQMVMWDNRFTAHAAQLDYTERRELHRVVVSGTVPF